MDNQIIATVLAATERKRIVGRIRFQKVFYLLEQLGLDSGLKFSYHHYGPYSEELSKSVQSACVVDKILKEQVDYTVYGNPFSTYILENGTEQTITAKIPPEKMARSLAEMLKLSSVQIELAATIHWIATKENFQDWRSELVARKAGKATDANVSRALCLLDKLGLSVS
ncbi:MAG: hypothetical protein AAF739_03510 [Pseudomonadota bacterium]